MERTHTETQSVEVIDAVVCDVCGIRITPDNHTEYPEMIRASGIGGYGSVIGDGAQWSLDVCQHCFVEQLGPFIRRDSD